MQGRERGGRERKLTMAYKSFVRFISKSLSFFLCLTKCVPAGPIACVNFGSIACVNFDSTTCVNFNSNMTCVKIDSNMCVKVNSNACAKINSITLCPRPHLHHQHPLLHCSPFHFSHTLFFLSLLFRVLLLGSWASAGVDTSITVSTFSRVSTPTLLILAPMLRIFSAF